MPKKKPPVSLRNPPCALKEKPCAMTRTVPGVGLRTAGMQNDGVGLKRPGFRSPLNNGNSPGKAALLIPLLKYLTKALLE